MKNGVVIDFCLVSAHLPATAGTPLLMGVKREEMGKFASASVLKFPLARIH